ncbi:MAG: redoxin domain-containing protein [Clostridia bacterium]|nr:redoxin domain-containing protein [Clostridia bacterium]
MQIFLFFQKSLKSEDRVTPVCTTEMIAFSKADTYFKQQNACLLGLSIDSNASHLAWLYDIYCKTGIRVPFPIIADRNGTIARKYGMIANDISNTETVRNVFIIDDKGIVRAILVYPMNVGRCIPEILRVLQALQIADCNKEATPANWCPYEPMIVPMPQTYQALEERMNMIQKNRNGFNWYLSFKQPEECCNRSLEQNQVKQIEDKKEIK